MMCITKCIKNSYFVVNWSIISHIGLRQICDLTNLKGCKFGYFDYRAEFAMYFAKFHTPVRWRAYYNR